MTFVSRMRHLLARLLRRERVERELDEEVESYFRILAEREQKRGLTYEEAMLFGTSPLDVHNLLVVSALFLLVALAACAVPAWRAARVSPMTALRQE
jgi:ABC-type lipoprotein release transport system permease subunit